jgi:hypothetical protein
MTLNKPHCVKMLFSYLLKSFDILRKFSNNVKKLQFFNK